MKPGEQIPSTLQPVEPPGGPVREEDKIMLVLAYLGLLALIPLLTVKDSHYVTWHAKNGLVLGAGGGLALSIISAILTPVGCLGPIIGLFGGVALLVIDMMSMVKALNGQRWRLPGVSDLAEKL